MSPVVVEVVGYFGFQAYGVHFFGDVQPGKKEQAPVLKRLVDIHPLRQLGPRENPLAIVAEFSVTRAVRRWEWQLVKLWPAKQTMKGFVLYTCA